MNFSNLNESNKDAYLVQVLMPSKHSLDSIQSNQWNERTVIIFFYANLISAIANLFTSCIIIFDKKSRKLPSNYLIVNLSCIHFVRLLFNLYIFEGFDESPSHTFKTNFCKISHVGPKFYNTSLKCTLMFLLILRFREINPIQSQYNKWELLMVNLTIWLIGIGLSFPNFWFVELMELELDNRELVKLCFIKTQKSLDYYLYLLYSLFYLCVSGLITWIIFQGYSRNRGYFDSSLNLLNTDESQMKKFNDQKKVMKWVVLIPVIIFVKKLISNFWSIINRMLFGKIAYVFDTRIELAIQWTTTLYFMVIPSIYYWTNSRFNQP